MATVNILPAFGYKWAQDGTVEAIDDAQYKVGWSFIGAVSPSMEQFNKVHQIADEKANYLYGQMSALYAAAGVTPAAATPTSLRDSIGMARHGQCRLSVASATSLLLKPYNGNSVWVNAAPLLIGPSGITVSNSGLAASTKYYVYLSGTTAAPLLTFSATGHEPNAAGIEVKIDEASKSLVGMVYTNASSQFVDSASARLCLNWFNRRDLHCNLQGTGLTTASAAFAELSTTLRAQFLTWADESIMTLANGCVQTTSSGAVGMQSFLDGAPLGISQSISFATNGLIFSASSSSLSTQSEAMHTAQVYSLSTAGTASWNAIQNLVQIRG